MGAGFAAFESAGYAFNLLTAGSSFAKTYGNMNDTIILRAILTIGGHVVWAALEGAGLALAGKGKPFSWGDLVKKEFLILFLVAVILHGWWDWMPLVQRFRVPYLDAIGATVVVWVFVLYLLRRGLAEVNKKARLAEQGLLYQ